MHSKVIGQVRCAARPARPCGTDTDQYLACFSRGKHPAGGRWVCRIDPPREFDDTRALVELVILGHLDYYVNNAAWTWNQPITRIDAESWRRTIDTNLSAAVFASRKAYKHIVARHRRESTRGSIVIIGSTARFFPSYRETAYRISKMGLRMLMQNLAIEMAPYGIRVNMITPGHYQTRMTGGISLEMERTMLDIIPAHRFGEVEEIGNTVAFLLSERLSPYTYGADIVIDGGLMMHPLGIYSQEEIEGFNL
jgi:glucose 1-dehydrogenase